jgi:Predicted DNA binding protein
LIREFRGNLFLKPPIILSPSRFEIKFLITEDKIEIFKSFLDNNKLKYKWVKVNRIKIEKEKSKEEAFELLRFALEMGYYENPRRVKADDLAKMLGISKSTFIRKLRNYEKRIIADSLSLKDNLD